MTDGQFSDLIDRYGATLDQWPAADRAVALTLLANSPRAQNELKRAQALETSLKAVLRNSLDPASLSPERIDQVMARTLAAVHHLPPRSRRPLQRIGDWFTTACDGWIRYGVPMAVGAVLGIVVGHVSLPSSYSEPETQAGLNALIELSHTTRLFGS